jgi:hypothetical protein
MPHLSSAQREETCLQGLAAEVRTSAAPSLVITTSPPIHLPPHINRALDAALARPRGQALDLPRRSRRPDSREVERRREVIE